MINKIGKSIYFPDVLDGSTMISDGTNNYSYYKGPLMSEDKNIQFKSNLFLGINKLIELANIFECVYLDKIEFLFLIKDFYKIKPSICIELLKNGKISFINADKFFMFYCIEKENNPLQLYSLPKVSNDKLISEFSLINDNEFLLGVNCAINKSINSKVVNGEIVTNQCSNDIRNGYYQGLAIGMNHFLNINEGNNELYDLIAQLNLNQYICNLYEIECIYLKPYFYWADKYKCLFLNGIVFNRIIFKRESIPNITFAAASSLENKLSNDELLNKSKSFSKQINISSYKKYEFLKEAYSTEIADDYRNSVISFMNGNGATQRLNFIPFENYKQDLEKQGKVLRITKSFIKIVPKEFLPSFLSGNIKFSKPIIFTKNDGTKGQNDATEGLFKSEIINGKRINTRNLYDLNYTNICCFYGLDNYMFVKSKTENDIKLKATIKKEYFQGYFNESNKGKYVVVFIKPDEFIRRLIDSFIKYGIREEDVIISPVTYIKKNEDFWLSCEPPLELFYKDIFYLPQNEIRVLIRNSAGKYDHLFNEFGVINIGKIDDICSVYEDDFTSDLECTLISDNKMIFSL